MSRYILEKARDGGQTVYYEQESRRIYLHSRFNPRQEAEDLLKNYDVVRHDFIVILGNGLGYLKEALSERESVRKIFAVEKDPGLYQIFLRSAGREGDDTVLVNKSPDEVVSLIIPRFSLLEYRGFLVIELPSVVNRDKEYYGIIKRKLQDELDKSVNNQLTESRLGVALINSFFRNAVFLAGTPLARPVKESPPQGDLVICAAGPSLVSDIPALCKIRSSCTLLAVDTALPYLLKCDIRPDAVFSMDPQYFSYLHFYQQEFNGLRVFDFFSGALPENRGGQTALLVTGNFISHSLFDREDIIPFQGGSVTNLIFQAFAGSAARIIFTGLDLGYSRHRMYVPHSYPNSYFLKRNFRLRTLSTHYFDFYLSRARREVRRGTEEVRTTSSMIGYYSWLIDHIGDFSKVFFSNHCLAGHDRIKRIDLERLEKAEKKEPFYLLKKRDQGRLGKKLKALAENEEFISRLTRLVIVSRYLTEWRDFSADAKREKTDSIRSYLREKLRLLLKNYM